MFGLRRKPPKRQADDDGVVRVLPKELFQGKVGEILRQAGITQDMPGNIVSPAPGGLKPLDYRIEYGPIFPLAVFDHPRIGSLFKEVTGIEYNMRGNHVWLFVDAITVEAVNASPIEMRQVLVESGCGLTQYTSDTTGRTEFLLKELDKMAALDCPRENLKTGFLSLYMFMDGNIKGLVNDGSGKLIVPENPKPQCTPGFEPFDPVKALEALVSG